MKATMYYFSPFGFGATKKLINIKLFDTANLYMVYIPKGKRKSIRQSLNKNICIAKGWQTIDPPPSFRDTEDGGLIARHCSFDPAWIQEFLALDFTGTVWIHNPEFILIDRDKGR